VVATLNNSVAIFLACEQEVGQVTLLVIALVAKKDADWQIMKTRMSTNEVFILAGLLKKTASIILVGSILWKNDELSVNFLRYERNPISNVMSYIRIIYALIWNIFPPDFPPPTCLQSGQFFKLPGCTAYHHFQPSTTESVKLYGLNHVN
jgi:hypothetical protein